MSKITNVWIEPRYELVVGEGEVRTHTDITVSVVISSVEIEVDFLASENKARLTATELADDFGEAVKAAKEELENLGFEVDIDE